MNKSLTILIPAFNEQEGIVDTLKKLQPFVKKNKWQVIIINDGSTDNTASIVQDFSEFNLINHPYNKGYGASLKTGIRMATTDLVASYDADGQHNPSDLENLYLNLSNYDIMIGQRSKNSHQSWLRKPGKWILRKTANFLTGRKIPDLNSGLRIIDRNIILRMLHLLPDGFSFSTTSTVACMNMGYNVGYYPITVGKRIGKSTVKQLKHGSQTVLLIIRLIVLFNPLKVFIPVSMFLLIIGLIYEVLFGIIIYSSGVRLIPAALFTLLTSVIIFFFGLVVDQVSEMRKHQSPN